MELLQPYESHIENENPHDQNNLFPEKLFGVR